MTRRQWRIDAASRLMAAIGDGREARGTSRAVFLPGYEKTDALRESAILLRFCLGLEPADLVRDPDAELSDEENRLLDACLDRRCTSEPMAYITGSREFYGRGFTVARSTLIPRPDTETLADEAIRFLKKKRSESPGHMPAILDLGTGSGCIAVTLLAEIPDAVAVGVDIDKSALAVAELNARRLLGRMETDDDPMQAKTASAPASGSENESAGRAKRFITVCGDMTMGSFITGLARRFGRFDLVVSNPPYVTENEFALLSPDVRCFEPKAALVSAAEAKYDGCRHIAAVIRAAAVLLKPGGMVALEHGYAQGQAVRAMLSGEMWRGCETVRDLSGLERCTTAVFSPYAKNSQEHAEERSPCK